MRLLGTDGEDWNKFEEKALSWRRKCYHILKEKSKLQKEKSLGILNLVEKSRKNHFGAKAAKAAA
jgi:hypothetical protein